jgi:hypothetical protein
LPAPAWLRQRSATRFKFPKCELPHTSRPIPERGCLSMTDRGGLSGECRSISCAFQRRPGCHSRIITIVVIDIETLYQEGIPVAEGT